MLRKHTVYLNFPFSSCGGVGNIPKSPQGLLDEGDGFGSGPQGRFSSHHPVKRNNLGIAAGMFILHS